MDYYRVGTLVNTHGIRGEVKVVVVTDFPEERFKVHPVSSISRRY